MNSITEYGNYGRIYERCLNEVKRQYPCPQWGSTVKEFYGYIVDYCMKNSIEYEEIRLDVYAKAWLELAVKYESRAINHKPR